jgi:hypothetical protein
MCAPTAYPWRQNELDGYLAHIIEIHNIWPTKFFEYHKSFSAKCAITLKQKHILIDWSKGDEELLKRVVAGAEVNSCNICNSTAHVTSMCSEDVSKSTDDVKLVGRKQYQRKDKYDRQILYHEGVPICNNFNYSRCALPYCRRAHVCSSCLSPKHGKSKCTERTAEKTTSNIKSRKAPGEHGEPKM